MKISAHLVLRSSIAFAFLYAAIGSFLQPEAWIGYFPTFLTNLFPAQPLLIFFSLSEIILAIWLISGYKSFYSGIVAFLVLFGIVVTNLGGLIIVFRDVSIAGAALALSLLSKQRK